MAQTWPGPADFDGGSWLWQNTYVMDPRGDCSETSIEGMTYEALEEYISTVNGDTLAGRRPTSSMSSITSRKMPRANGRRE